MDDLDANLSSSVVHEKNVLSLKNLSDTHSDNSFNLTKHITSNSDDSSSDSDNTEVCNSSEEEEEDDEDDEHDDEEIEIITQNSKDSLSSFLSSESTFDEEFYIWIY